jgi:glycosyltransferase involved in cell wall biosynthesis
VKDPATLFAAVRLLEPVLPIHFRHYGAALDERLGNEARALEAHDARYRYLAARPHPTVRKAIQRAHVLVHPSLSEGGANVIVEAVNSGTPVLASRVPGNVGMLGKRYSGYFEPGDAAGLATMIQRALHEPRLLQRLNAQCAERRALFRPQAEARAVNRLVARLLAKGGA